MVLYRDAAGKRRQVLPCTFCGSDPTFTVTEQISKKTKRVEGIFYFHCTACGKINTLEGSVKQLTAEGAALLWNDLVLDEMCSRAVKSCTELHRIFGGNNEAD